MLKQLIAAVCGGLMIAIGGCVYLNTAERWVGAIFFSVALISICYCGFGLFTGRVGFVPDNFSGRELCGLSMTLIGNAIGTFTVGSLVYHLMPETIGAAALASVAGKVSAEWGVNLLRAVLCGVLMYLAVRIFREKNTVVGIIFCVPAFILAGFEHSIADMFYFAASGYREWNGLWFLLLVIAGNAIGGMLLPLLARLGNLCDTGESALCARIAAKRKGEKK